MNATMASPLDGGPSEAARRLNVLAAQGVRLWVEDGRLRCSAPPDRLDDDLRAWLKHERETLISMLAPSATPPSNTISRDAPLQMTLAQQALLPLARGVADGRYNIPLAVEIAGGIDPMRLNAALNALQDRHDALRLTFPLESGPVLRPGLARVGNELLLTLPPGAESEDAADAAVQALLSRPFDLERGPLWRYGLIQFGEQRSLAVLVFHHLIFDGFSRDIYLQDLATLYDGALDATRPLQCADFAAWERGMVNGPRGALSRDWWRDRFEAAQASTALPPAPSDAEHDGSLTVTFPATLLTAVRGHAAATRIPPGAIAITATALALHRITGQQSLLACTPLTNRDPAEATGIVGYLNRVAPLLVQIRPDDSVGALSASVTHDLFAADAHRFAGASEMMATPGLARTQVNRFMVAWQERRTDGALTFGGVPARALPVARAQADFGLAVQFEADGDSLGCQISYRADVLGADGAAAFAALLSETLALVSASGDGRVADLAPPHFGTAQLADRLKSHPGVDDAFVVAEPETGGFSAWIVLNEYERVTSEALRDWLILDQAGLAPPLRITPLAVLPRDASGAIDEAALSTAAAPPVFQSPATETERLIADLWRRTLWLDRPVGRDEDFRLLGGHSLLAVRMLTDLEAALGRRLPASTPLRLTTVANLARAIDAPEDAAVAQNSGALDAEIMARLRAFTASWDGDRPFPEALIVGRNTQGQRPALFWCLQNEHELSQLARYIGPDQPVFGMRSGHAAMIKSPENIDRLAAHYASEILTAAPSGPLFVGGNCQAAVIAFRIADHLKAAGCQPALLILHEKVVLEPYAGRIALTFGRDSDRNPWLASDDPHADLVGYYGDFTMELVAGAHGQFFQEPNVFELVAAIRRRRDETPALQFNDMIAAGRHGDRLV